MTLKMFSIHQTLFYYFWLISAPSNLRENLFAQGEKIKNLSKEMQWKSLMLAYENYFLYDLENMITETFVSELNKNFSTYGLILFSGEAKTENKLSLSLIKPDNKLKFNLKKDVYKNEVGFELGKVHTKTSFSTTRDNVLDFGILCNNKK